ncbi:MAG: DUF559 domain-containing protein [Patescibacteria group bacterium]
MAFSPGKKNKVVLVGVLKTKRDLEALLRERWYRIPVAHAPVRRFRYLAFYQPACFGREGKCIRYYARVVSMRLMRRSDLVPDEPRHARAHGYYLQVRVGAVKTLSRPLRNRTPRRVSFGFTTLGRLLASRNLLELYRVAPIERLVDEGLRRAGIAAMPQYIVRAGTHRYRLDFAVPCRRGLIAIECDNRKAHAGPRQFKRDREKDARLKEYGWTVVRLPERDIVSNVEECVSRVRSTARSLGGPAV